MSAPGLAQANYVEGKIKSLGIQDIQLLFDEQLKMWVVCQVQKRGGLLLPRTYAEGGIRPHILWYCKTLDGHFRLPNDNDIMDIVVTAQRAKTTFKHGGEALADDLDAQSAEKDRKHKQKFHDKIHRIAPQMKKALKEGNI
jgi:hypothetical protein